MPKYVVSDAAGSDIRGIIGYTTLKWSPEQAARYSQEFESVFKCLLKLPEWGEPVTG